MAKPSGEDWITLRLGFCPWCFCYTKPHRIKADSCFSCGKRKTRCLARGCLETRVEHDGLCKIHRRKHDRAIGRGDRGVALLDGWTWDAAKGIDRDHMPANARGPYRTRGPAPPHAAPPELRAAAEAATVDLAASAPAVEE